MSAVVPFRTSRCRAKLSFDRPVWKIEMFGEDCCPLGTLDNIRIISAVVQYCREMQNDGWRIIYGPGADRVKDLIDMTAAVLNERR